MANTLRELTDGYALNQLRLVAEQLTNIGRLDKSLSNNFTFTNELLSANKAALQLKHALAESYNQRFGNIDLSQFNKQLNLTGKTLSDYQQELSMIGITGNKAFNDLARSIATAEKPLLGMGKIANSLWDTLGNTIKWQASSTIVQGVMKDVASATSYVKQLDNSLNNIQIVTNQSSAYMAEFAKNANKAAQELNTTTNEYAKASLIYYQQGLDNKQVQDRVATTIKLANVSGQSAKVVSDQLTAVWNNFYNGSKNLEFYADAMAALGATTASSSSEIAKGLEKFAAIADSTGLSFEYASSALATVVANTRQSADSVGTSFRTLFSRLQGLSLGETLDDGTTLNKYSKALLSVGVNIKEANGDLKNMDTILTELGSKWQSLAQDEKVALAQTVGGARNYTGLMSLMDNWDDFTTNLKTAQTAQGTLQRQADVYAKSWEAASAHVRAASESIYSNLLNDNFIKGIANLYGDFLGQIGQLTTNLGGAKGTFAGITSLLTQHIFRDKVPGLIASTGETLMGFTSRGSERLEARRQEALTALTTNTNISTYQEVNQAYAKQMQGTLNRQRDFDKAVEQGRIASYEVPIYQQLFQNIDAQKNQAIEQTETAARNKANAAVSDAYLERAMKTGIAQSRFSDEENKAYLGGLIQQKGLQEDQVRKRQAELDEVKAQREGAMQAKQDAMDHRRQLQNDSENIRVEVDKARSAMDQARTAYNQAVQDYGQNSHEAQVAAGQLGQATKTYNQVNSQHESIIDQYMQVDERIQTYDTALREHLEPAVRKKQSEYDAANHKLEGILGDIDYTQANINLRAQDSSLLTGYYVDSNGQRHESNPIGEQIKEARTNVNRAVSLEQLAKDLGFGQDMTGDAGDMVRRQAASTIMELVTGADASKLQEMFGTEIGQAISLQGTALTQSVDFSKKKDEDFNQYQERLKQELMDVFTSEEGGDLLSVLSESILDASIQASGESKENIANLKALSNRLIDSKLPGGQQIADLIDGIIGNTEEYQAVRARGGVEQAEESIGQRIGSAVRELSKPEQIAKSIGLISNLGMTVSTVEQTFHTLTDETATTGQKMGAFGTAIASGYSTFKSISDNAKDLFTLKDESAGFKFGNIKGLSNLGMGNLIAMGAMAVGTAAFQVGKTAYQNYSLNGRIQSGIEQYATQSQTIADKRTNYEQLDVITDEYNKQVTELRNSLQGSSDYFRAQAEINTIVGNMVKQYNLEYGKDYTIRDGTMIVDAASQERIREQAEQEYLDAVNQGNILQAKNTFLAAQQVAEREYKKATSEAWGTPEGISYDEFGSPIINDAYIQGQLQENSIYQAAIAKQKSAARNIAELSLANLANENNIEINDFIKSAFLNNDNLDDIVTEVIKEVEQGTLDGFWNNFASIVSFKGSTSIQSIEALSGLNNEEIWDVLATQGLVHGEKPKGDELKAALNGVLPQYVLREYLQSFIDDNNLKDISSYFDNYMQFTSSQLSDAINTHLMQDNGMYNAAIQSLTQQVTNIQGNLLSALSNNLSEDWLQSNDLINSDEFKSLIENYSLNQLQDISNYIITSGTIFGNKTAQTIFEQLSSGQNTKTLQQLSKINWDNTFSALGDINKLARNLGGYDNIYSEVLQSAINELGAEGGIFEQLYNSSGFSKVLDSLTAQFDTMGEITTGYVVKLSQKNEELNNVLSLGASGYAGLNINAAGLASAFNLINSGKLTREQMTSGVLSSLSTTHQLEAEKYKAFDVVDNQDLGRSGTDLLEYFSNAQKAYINAKSQDLTYDTPLQNIFRTLMPTYVRDAYIEANQGGNGLSFTQIMDSDKIPDSVKEFLGHTNKKGTKPVTTWSEVLDMYGGFIHDSTLTGDEAWKALGFDPNNLPELRPDQQAYFDKNGYTLETIANAMFGIDFSQGNLWLNDTTGNNTYGYNTKQTIDNITKIFSTMMPKEQAQNLAQIFTAHVGESSGGTILQENDAKAAIKDLKTQEPTSGGKRMYSQATLDALWWENSYFYNQMYQGGTEEERKAAFIKDITSGNGVIAPTLDEDFWKNNKGNGLISEIGEEYFKANGWTFSDETTAFNRLLRDFGVIDTKDGAGKSLNFNKLQELVTFLGGTDQDLQNLIDSNDELGEYFNGRTLTTSFTDNFGVNHTVEKGANESTQKYIDRITREQNQANKDTFSYVDKEGKTQQIYDPLGIYRRNFQQDSEGNVTWGHTDENGEWVEGPNPDEVPVNIAVDSDGNVYGVSQTGKVLVQDNSGQWTVREKKSTSSKPEPEPEQPEQEPEQPEPEHEQPEGKTSGAPPLSNAISNPNAPLAGLFISKTEEEQAAEEEADRLIKEQAEKEKQQKEAERQTQIQAEKEAKAFNDDAEQTRIEIQKRQEIQRREEEKQQREAEKEAERAAIEQQQREIEEEAERAALTASMPPSEYAKYKAWVEAGGSGKAIDWQYEKRTAEGPQAPEVGEKETKEKEPSNKEMREFLKENGYTSATINTAMREEGVSLKDLYQRVNSALTETNKQLKGINENTNATAENTGDFVQEQQDQQEQKTTDKAIGKDQTKGKDSKNKDIFGNTGNTTIINEGSGSDSGGEDGWSGGITTSPFGKTKFDFTKIGLGIGSAFGIGAKIGEGKGTNQKVTGKSYDSGGKKVDSGSGGGKIEVSWKQVASGQNNARLLAYASGKEGHIAVTGELGPELRIKSDGSMDILGKKGREYAWVEPDDRIYTASQSAGILKSNKIPGLEGLAKGINNYLPGHAAGEHVGGTDHTSSGSGGGGGNGGSRSRGGGAAAPAEKDPRYDPNTLKIRDVLERYYTILQQIDNITKAVERFSKVADRAWGRERIRAIEKQNEMQQKQYEAQKKYIAEIEDYLTTDQSALTTMIQEFVTGYNEGKEAADQISWAGAEFDENGVLTNYRDFVEKLVEQYNANAEANSRDKEAQYKFQEQLKDIQMYTNTLNLYEEQRDALEDIKNAILDTAIKAISYEVEYKLELSGDADRILNFQADKYKDDVYQAAKYLELLDQRADLTRQNLIAVQDGIFKTLGTYAGEAMRTGAMHDLEELGIYGTDQFKLDEELTDADEDETEEARIDRLKGISTKVNEWLEQLREKNADAAAEIDKMIEHSEEEGQEDIITNYEEVIRRLNQQIDYTAVRAKVDEWLEELRGKNAEAAAEIDKIVQRNEAGEIINYRDVIERLNEENVRLSDEAIAVLMEDQDKFFEWMSDFRSNPGWVDFTTEHKDLLTNYMDQIYQYLQSLQETYEQTIEQLGGSIKATAKQMDAAIDEFDYYGDVYKTFGNIVDLTNRHMTDVSQEFFDTLNNKSMDNAINKIKGTVTNYHLLQNELAEVTKQYNEMQARANAATGEEQIYLQQSADKLKEQLDIANSQYEDAHKAFLSSWEDALSKMAENYKAAVEEASRNFEQGFSPLFNTLALLQAQFDREKALGDLYVDNYQRIHDLNKLNRDIQLSIDDTDNLKGKERLRDLQAEINQLQEDGTELSEYDLDILDKKYKLELARQALEDAKDAKSMVRLARDNNGNWSYVYTANQDDVDKAEQDYEDAIREMEQANEDYIDNIQDQILQVQQEAQQAILALQPEDFATYEDYLAAVNNIQNSMYQTLDFLRSQLNNAFGNNEWLDPYIVDRYGINDHDLTTDFGDTTLANLLDNPDIDKAMKKAKQNFEDTLKKPVLDAFIEYSERQDEVYQAAEHDIATIGKDFQDEMESIADSSDYQVEVVENLSQRVQDAFNDMAAVVDEKTKKHLDEVDELVNRYEKLVEALTEVKRLSGENLPAGMTQEIGTTDTWREIEDLENLLKENGHIRVLEDLTNLNKEDVVYRDEKLKDATEKIDDWVAALGDATSEIAEGIERNDAGQITNYKDIVQKLAGIEQTDENKETLKNIKKWKEKDDASVLMDDHQVLTDEGLWTYLVAGDDYTKQYLKDKIDNAAKNGAIDVGADVDETEKAKVENYLKAHGIVYVKWDGGLEKFESRDDWLAWYEKHKYVAPSSDGGGGSGHHAVSAEENYISWHGWGNGSFSGIYAGYDTGGYTGRWQSADTGMYTGEWPSGSVRRNGRLAWLHQKELVLNAHDTENFLDAMEIVRQLDNLTNWMANGLGDLAIPKVTTESSELEQNVHIEAEFPNVTDHNEIEQAFNNLVNMASMHASKYRD